MVPLRLAWTSVALLLLLAASTASAQHQIACPGDAAGGYAAFPDICRLSNGDLFCVFYSGYGHVSTPTAKLPKGGRIMAVRSPDSGNSWSKPVVVIDTSQDDRDPIPQRRSRVRFPVVRAPNAQHGISRDRPHPGNVALYRLLLPDERQQSPTGEGPEANAPVPRLPSEVVLEPGRPADPVPDGLEDVLYAQRPRYRSWLVREGNLDIDRVSALSGCDP